MLSTPKLTPQIGLFHGLADQLDQKHPLYQLANTINWKFFDDAFKQLHQSYTRVVKRLSNLQRFKGTRHGAKAARKPNKKIQVIAGRLVREIARKLPLISVGRYLPALKLYRRVLSQKRGDSNKIYSLHEPLVTCYSKGKVHNKFDPTATGFGSKTSILVDQKSGIILGVLNFTQTLYDPKTIPNLLEQYERLNGEEAKEVFVDIEYKGIKQ